MTGRRILVTGAAGFVGARIAEHLSARGHHVLTTDLTAHPNGLAGDLRDPAFRAKLLHWASPDTVVHAAALVPLTRDERGFRSTNVTASRELALEARRAGTRRFVLISSSAVYGIPRTHPITPYTPTIPVEPYGESKLDAENATRDGWGAAGLTILRPRTILGNGRRGIIGTLDRWIDEGYLIPLPAGGRHRLQLVHVDDVARIVVHVITHDIDGTWPVGATNCGVFAEELADLIERRDSRSRIVSVPPTVFKTIARIADRAGLIPFTRWHYDTLGHDFAFDPAWTPPRFAYHHTNTDVLDNVTGTSRTPTTGTSAHTRDWETGTLDKALGTLTALVDAVHTGLRGTTSALRALRRIVTLVVRAIRTLSRPALAAARWFVRETRTNRPAGKHPFAARVLLGPLVRHDDREIYGRALTSLRRHQHLSGRAAGIGMILAAQLRRLRERDARKQAPGRWFAAASAPVTDLAEKLRAAHLSAAISEPTPLPRRTPAGNRPGTSTPTSTDLLVVGSGPGAAMLAHAAGETSGRSILVVEAGERTRIPTERHHSLEHVLEDFHRGGAELCLSRPLTQIAQARVFGGGSEVNSGFYHDLPAHHRRAWCQTVGIDENEWLAAETEVRRLLELSPAPTNAGDSVIARGAEAVGHANTAVARWRTYDREGFRQHGMTRQTWDQNGDVTALTNRTVNRVEPRRDGLLAILSNGEEIRARRIALCAGATNTPRILVSSGLVARRDLRFNLHPMVRVVARCRPDDAGRHDVDPCQALSASGYKYGGAVSTPSLLGAALGEIVENEQAATLRSFYASFEPSGHGGFLRTPAGLLPYFAYSRNDRRKLHEAAETLRELLLAAGACPITTTRHAAAHPSSVHVFGSAPAGGRLMLPRSSLLTGDPRIAVYDASLLPGAPGVNPQGPLMVLALVLARRQLAL